MKRTLAISVLASAALWAAHADAQIVWRSPAPRAPAAGEVVGVSEEGVTLRSGEGEAAVTRLVGWQRVGAIEGPLAVPALRFAATADMLWRIEQRVARGDYRLAESLAEPRYQQMLTSGHLSGPSAALIVESVLRCRLARAFTTGAITAALDLGAIAAGSGDGSAWIGWSGQGVEVQDPRWRTGPVLDRDTLLCPWTPPIFDRSLASRGLTALVQSQDWARLQSAPAEAGIIASLYRWAAEAEAQGRASGQELDLPGKDSNHPGVKLVRWIIESRYGTEAQRRAARQALVTRINEEQRRQATEEAAQAGDTDLPANVAPRWIEAWCRLAVGRSLVEEAEPAQRRQGVIQLLHLPARFADQYPSLSALSLRLAGDALSRQGDEAGALKLRDDIARIDPQLAVPDTSRAPPAKPSPTDTSTITPTTKK